MPVVRLRSLLVDHLVELGDGLLEFLLVAVLPDDTLGDFLGGLDFDADAGYVASAFLRFLGSAMFVVLSGEGVDDGLGLLD